MGRSLRACLLTAVCSCIDKQELGTLVFSKQRSSVVQPMGIEIRNTGQIKVTVLILLLKSTNVAIDLLLANFPNIQLSSRQASCFSCKLM